MLKDYLRLVSNSILIIGPAKSGKTSMLRRLKTGEFLDQIKPTYGFSSNMINNTPFIEIGGQESYKTFWQQAIDKNPVLIIFIIDVSSQQDLKVYKKFRKDLGKLGNFLLVANKIDLIDENSHPIVYELKKLEPEILLCSFKTGENFWRLSEYIAEFCNKSLVKSQPLGKAIADDKSDSVYITEKEDRKRAHQLLEDFNGKF